MKVRSAAAIGAAGIIAGCGSTSSQVHHASAHGNGCPPGQYTTQDGCQGVPTNSGQAQNMITGGTGTDTTGTTGTTGGAPTAPMPLGQSANLVGGQIVGEGQGEEVSVTVTKVLDPAPETGLTSLGASCSQVNCHGASPGQRFVEVQLSVQNTGTATYTEDLSMGSSLIGSDTNGPVGQVDPSLTGTGRCSTVFSSSVNIPVGQTEKGCLFFDVPKGQPVDQVQIQTQGGGNGYTATWNIR